MVAPIVEAFKPELGKQYIDATFGGGGHASHLLDAGAAVLGIDQDQDAHHHAQALLQKYKRLKLEQANFTNLTAIAQKHNFTSIDGILFDLGVSSWQLDQRDRGFSFMGESHLDMRMNQDLSVTAADLLAALSAKELTQLFQLYGDEPQARSIAQAIVKQRNQRPLTSTTQLADLVSRVYRHRRGKLHPATKVFQALRIAVNDEINALKDTLPDTLSLLKPGGILAVISFHEGEDRVVKQFMRHQAESNQIEILNHKVIIPDDIEQANNPRSRSAKLRLARQIN